jgi:hypothetical protein
VEINSAWETIRENINISAKMNLGYYELKKCKPWFDVGCSKLMNQMKQIAVVLDPSEINGDTLNNIRREANRHFKNKKREYLKDKINELATDRRTSETCIEKQMDLRGATDLQITSLRMRVVICL